MIMQKTLAVSELKNGTVIDHIKCGYALKILQLLNLLNEEEMITVGLHLKNEEGEKKDLIKIENRELSKEQAAQIATLSPSATVNIIRNYEVVDKFKVETPRDIKGVFICPNPLCITQTEEIKTHFDIRPSHQDNTLKCRYCEKLFSHEEISLKI